MLMRKNIRVVGTLSVLIAVVYVYIHLYQKTGDYREKTAVVLDLTTVLITEPEEVPDLPDIIPPDENIKLGVAGISPAADELERLWNYVYKTQYQCPKLEMYGGRNRGGLEDGDGAYPVCMSSHFWKGNTANGNRCLVYSFGIGKDFSFDDAMAMKGCEVHSFDPSIDLDDNTVRESGVIFHKIGIAGKDRDKGFQGWKMRTLRTLLRELGHEGRYLDYLKVDTDRPGGGGFEDELMQEMLDTGLDKCVRQFGFEIHLAGPIIHPLWLRRCRVLYRQMTQLNKRGYRLFATEDNVRYDRIIRKDPNFSQLQKKASIINNQESILWEVAFVNFDPQPCGL